MGPIKYGSVNFAVAMASEFEKNVDTFEFAEFSSRKKPQATMTTVMQSQNLTRSSRGVVIVHTTQSEGRGGGDGYREYTLDLLEHKQTIQAVDNTQSSDSF